jgi:hypothetical protein
MKPSRKQLPHPINVNTGDPEPDPHRFDGMYKLSQAWSKKHPNPYAPRSKSAAFKSKSAGTSFAL